MNTTPRTLALAAGLLASAAFAQPRTAVPGSLSIGFEPPAYVAGPLMEQGNWTAQPTPVPENAALVQAKLASEGTQAVWFSAAPLGCVVTQWSLPFRSDVYGHKPPTITGQPLLDIQWDMQLPPGKPTNGWVFSIYDQRNVPDVCLSVDPEGLLWYWTSSGGIPIPTKASLSRGEWHSIRITLDYAYSTVQYFLDGKEILPREWDHTLYAPGCIPGGFVTAFALANTGPGLDEMILDNLRFTPRIVPCYANCDGSTEPPAINIADFKCFVDQFAQGLQLPPEAQVGCYANCDGSKEVPVLNVADYMCFLNQFSAGCW